MGNNPIPKFIFCLSRFPVYRGSVLGRFYCIIIIPRLDCGLLGFGAIYCKWLPNLCRIITIYRRIQSNIVIINNNKTTTRCRYCWPVPALEFNRAIARNKTTSPNCVHCLTLHKFRRTSNRVV